MEFLLSLFLDNWAILAPIIYEFIARLWPSKWNISILDTIWKIVNFIVPNNRKPDGTEVIETDSSGALVNKIKVKVGRHVLRVLIPLFMVTIGLTACHAQTWQNYKGIRLVNNSDTTKQLPVQGSLFYDDVADILYLHNGTKWVEVGGGGSLDSANFWKTKSDTQLFGDRRVNIDDKLSLTLGDNTTGLTILRSLHATDITGRSAYGYSFVTTYDNRVSIGSIASGVSNNFTVRPNDTQSTKPILYTTDLFSSYTDRTVPDWGNVKARTAFGSGLVPFGNATSDGLTTGQLSFNNSSNTLSVGKEVIVGGFSGQQGSLYLHSGGDPTKTNIQMNRSGAPNQILLSNTSTGFSTSIFAGEIQIDNTEIPQSDLTINNSGVQATYDGSGNVFQVVSNNFMDVIATNDVRLVSSTGKVTLQDSQGVFIPNAPDAVTSGAVLVRNTSTGKIEQRTNISSSSAGNYNPTVTPSSANINSATELNSTFTQVGNIVTVYSRVTLDLNATGSVIFRLSLPFPATFLSDNDLIGLATTVAAGTSGVATADTSTNEARIEYVRSAGAGTSTVNISFSYNKGSE